MHRISLHVHFHEVEILTKITNYSECLKIDHIDNGRTVTVLIQRTKEDPVILIYYM